VTHLVALAAYQAIDPHPTWEIAKGVMLTSCTGLLTWIATTLRAVLREQIDQRHILVGVNGKNGLQSDVRLLVKRVDVLEDWKIAKVAVERSEQEQHPGPDRRVSPRRTRDVVHEALDERVMRAIDESHLDDEE
jgi:hypothetical protein